MKQCLGIAVASAMLELVGFVKDQNLRRGFCANLPQHFHYMRGLFRGDG
jgi:hypothetical protein